eukprot:GILK01017235.1.p3 GENE.GILK01017235.1~~GILK01017235.1.p3  ORF type:complete len:110 (+),score=5.37 GILK01017235.1:95-424(+)
MTVHVAVRCKVSAALVTPMAAAWAGYVVAARDADGRGLALGAYVAPNRIDSLRKRNRKHAGLALEVSDIFGPGSLACLGAVLTDLGASRTPSNVEMIDIKSLDQTREAT